MQILSQNRFLGTRPLGIIWLLLLLTVSVGAPALATNSPEPVNAVVTLSTVGQSTGFRYDFGSLSSFQPSPLSHAFVLQNPTPLPQTISALRPSCGCTSAFLKEDTLPFILPPGQQVSVRVTLDPANLPSGPVSKFVWVYLQGQKMPAATLEMTGTLLPTVKLLPAALDFGSSHFGGRPTLPLSVTWNSALLPKGSQYRLVSTDPEVQITREPPTEAGTAPAQMYRCTLSPQADLGELSGKVVAVVTPPGGGPIVVGAVPIQGDISGDVASSPAVVAFGSVTAGQAGSQQIILTLAQPGKLTVASASPYLTVQQHSLPGSTPKTAQVLLGITLSGKAPAGPLTTELTVTTPSGQHLKVPVFALVGTEGAKP